MLQTIYETESCFSSTSTDSHQQPLELLSDNRGSSTAMPTAGESSLGKEAGRGAAVLGQQTKGLDPNVKSVVWKKRLCVCVVVVC